MNFKATDWDRSYKNKDNFLFYPSEEIIRFVSVFIKKKIGYREYINKKNIKTCLDLGCGIGRHILFLDDLELDVYGIDISEEAINYACCYFDSLKRSYLKEKLVIGSTTQLPYANGFFDCVISCGVLDSMNFSLAQESVAEVYRVLKDGGLFYFDVISGCDYNHYREYEGEEIVNTEHEKGTIQSYFNWRKINVLIGNKFQILDCILIQRESVIKPIKNSRYHIVVQKNKL